MSGASDLLSSGRRIGELVWVESRLFEVIGGFVVTTPEPAPRAFMAAASGHHGWHAELLSTLLPEVVGGPGIDELVGPAAGQAEAMAELASISSTADRLEQMWRGVVADLVGSAEAHIARSSPLAEGATHRILKLVMAQERADMAVAERLVVGLEGGR